jgi:hypothetical protein
MTDFRSPGWGGRGQKWSLDAGSESFFRSLLGSDDPQRAVPQVVALRDVQVDADARDRHVVGRGGARGRKPARVGT